MHREGSDRRAWQQKICTCSISQIQSDLDGTGRPDRISHFETGISHFTGRFSSCHTECWSKARGRAQDTRILSVWSQIDSWWRWGVMTERAPWGMHGHWTLQRSHINGARSPMQGKCLHQGKLCLDTVIRNESAWIAWEP